MVTIKAKFRRPNVDERKGAIYYQIICGRKVRQVLSDYRVFPSEWDEGRSTVRIYPACKRIQEVMEIKKQIMSDIERLRRIVVRFDDAGLSYSVDDVVEEYERLACDCRLFNFMNGMIDRLKRNGRIRTSETYRSALNSFRNFRRNEDVMLDCIDGEMMEAYEAWLHDRHVTSNTVSFYMRILRAVYNRGVEQGMTDNRNPFRHVYTGIDKTLKRALPIQAIRKIKALELPDASPLCFARDMFLMSFYLRGMSFIDMAYLRKSDLRGGYIVYRRRKTGQQLIIKWTKEMKLMLERYPSNKSDYLLPIIRSRSVNERSVYRRVGYNINHHLKSIACMAGITVPLTLYVARLSWASAAKAKGVPISVISEGMGHDSEATTRIYLASLEASVVDRANSLILSSL